MLKSTEQVTKLDLVALQLFIALGCTFLDLNLSNRHSAKLPFPLYTSIQLRVNAEDFQPDGNAFPTAGSLHTFAPPFGYAYRLDSAAHPPLQAGKLQYKINPSFDSLLAKLIVTAPTYESALQLAEKGLANFQLAGCETNRNLLRVLLQSKEMQQAKGRAMHTGFVQANAKQLHGAAKALSAADSQNGVGPSSAGEASSAAAGASATQPEGRDGLTVPIAGVVVSVDVKEGDNISVGQQVAVLEAMKMEHIIRADKNGTVRKLAAKKGDTINAGTAVLFYSKGEVDADDAGAGKDAVTQIAEKVDLDEIPPALKSLQDRKSLSAEENRKEAVKRRHAVGYKTATENLRQLVDEGSFIEFGDLTVAAQRSRIELEKLKQTTSNDGVM